jgi:hypothetical protein
MLAVWLFKKIMSLPFPTYLRLMGFASMLALVILLLALPLDFHERSKQQMQTDLFTELNQVQGFNLKVVNNDQVVAPTEAANFFPSDDEFNSSYEI